MMVQLVSTLAHTSFKLVRYLLPCLFFVSHSSHAAISVVDDSGVTIRLSSPAQRIISLAPHTTELLFAAGAGKSIVAVTAWSDYPPQAKNIPSVGSATELDVERIIKLQPDLVVAWKNGNKPRQIAHLRKFGIQVFESEPKTLDEIANSIKKLSMLAGTEKIGEQQALAFQQKIQVLKNKYQHAEEVRYFYQIWQKPLMTLNGEHLISQALKICGGKNIFSELVPTAPTVNSESVIQNNPEVIFMSSEEKNANSLWQSFPNMMAVSRNNLFTFNGSIMNRAGPRMAEATEQLCEKLELARQRRPH
ncbi:MAG: cobalamin-binding protein [Burkholderiales bacterium]|nr:cobalamin-binding protein [Burkholderiales bacterium]